MLRLPSAAVRRCAADTFRLAAALLLLTAGVSECLAIEMFTYFYDGSRIGLPSLEVPVEAYPGIPLRSDRLRARRRALRQSGQPAAVAQPGMPAGITIRAMPDAQAVRPAPRTVARPQPTPRRTAPTPDTAPMPPLPEEVLAHEVPTPLGE